MRKLIWLLAVGMLGALPSFAGSGAKGGGGSHGREPALASKGAIDPHKVFFSQDSISVSFKDKTNPPPDELAKELKSGKVNAASIPPIRIFWHAPWQRWVTLDNRRLYAFKKAGIPIPYQKATEHEVAGESFKFTSRNKGESIVVRGVK